MASSPFEEWRQKDARKDSHILMEPSILGFSCAKDMSLKIQE